MRRKPAALLLVLSLVVLAIALMPAAGLAAKGGNGQSAGKPGAGGDGGVTGSFTLVLHDSNSNRVPNYGESVTFTVSSSAAYPMVTLTCYQDRSAGWVTN